MLGRETSIKLNILKLDLNVGKIESSPQPFPKMLNINIKLSIDESIKPVQQPLRRIPVSAEQKVEDKLNEALAQDIIEQVNGPCRWISPIVVVYKESGDIRLCIDMRRANAAIQRQFSTTNFRKLYGQIERSKSVFQN